MYFLYLLIQFITITKPYNSNNSIATKLGFSIVVITLTKDSSQTINHSNPLNTRSLNEFNMCNPFLLKKKKPCEIYFTLIGKTNNIKKLKLKN